MSMNTIPLRKLGKNGPDVPALGFGLMGLSGAYGTPPSDEERFKVLDRAVELGATFWDTADMYLDSEELVGKWFKRTGKRDQIFLSTKSGILLDGMNFVGTDSSADYCRKQCEKSLERLGTDTIDLYYSHRQNPDTPIEETMRALVQLQSEGKIKHIGLSELSSDSLQRACKIGTVAAVQVEYSPFVRNIEEDEGTHLLQTCRELGVAVVCYSPLGRGLLTGRFSTKEAISGDGDIRSRLPWFSEENLANNARIVNEFKAIADRKGCSSSQLALAWMLHQGNDIIPNPGTKTVKYLEDNIGALNVHLSEDEVIEIRKFLESNEVAGYRSIPSGKEFAYVMTKKEQD